MTPRIVHGASLVATDALADVLADPGNRGQGAAIAAMLQWSPNRMSKVRHQRTRVRPAEAHRIADHLGYRVDELFMDIHRTY